MQGEKEKSLFVLDLQDGQEFTEFFLAKSVNIKKDSRQKNYLDMTLADSTGDINAKKWELVDEEIPGLEKLKEGDVVKVKGLVSSWNGSKQVKIARIRKGVETDPVEMFQLVKTAPEKSQDMYDYIYERASRIKDEDYRGICISRLTENREKLMYYPAASKNHHAIYGGLLYHIKRMLMNGDLMCTVYTGLDADLVATGVILHDMEKINEIESNTYGVSPGYFTEGVLLGHIVQGVRSIDQYAREHNMPAEKSMLLQHMILSHHYEPEYGSPKRPMFPEAEILHHLDMIDARMYDMFDAMAGVEPGDFSDKVWTLDNRKVYVPKKDQE